MQVVALKAGLYSLLRILVLPFIMPHVRQLARQRSGGNLSISLGLVPYLDASTMMIVSIALHFIAIGSLKAAALHETRNKVAL